MIKIRSTMCNALFFLPYVKDSILDLKFGFGIRFCIWVWFSNFAARHTENPWFSQKSDVAGEKYVTPCARNFFFTSCKILYSRLEFRIWVWFLQLGLVFAIGIGFHN